VLKQQHQLFVALLVIVDGLVVVLASFMAWGVRMEAMPSHRLRWEDYPKQALVLYTVPVTLLCLRWLGLYRPRRDRSLLNEVAQVARASVLALLATFALLYVFQSSVFDEKFARLTWLGITWSHGRIQLTALAVILPSFLILHRVCFRTGLRILRRRGWNQRHVAIVGVGRLGQIVARTLARNSWTGIRVAYFVSHQDRTRRQRCLDRPVMGGLDDLERIMTQAKPDAVYVALPAARSNLLTQVLARLDRYPVDVRVVPDLNPRYLPQSMAVSELDGMPILSYRECPTSGVGGVSKRVLDVVGAAAAMLVFSPIMLLCAAVVRLSGPGPVIFRQRRVSLGGEVFNIYKFRTMFHVEDEDLDPRAAKGASPSPSLPSTNGWTLRNDPRITSVGRWLRRTSLDELPQLLNVLRGDMSLVGPRPERPELIERFREDWRGYMLRQHVKAGITGWAQVNGHRGQSSLRKRLQYDLFYIRHWSLGFDLKILWLTLFRGFVHKNAH
jgi:Undecaprenyl-phosphate glucose phosphotransferase